MEDFKKCDLDFEDNELHLLMLALKDCFDDNQINFCQTCKTIYDIWIYCKGNYFKAKDNEYYNSYKLLAKFGFDKKAVNGYKRCYERFVFHGANILLNDYKDFSPSKLFELLVLSSELSDELVKKQFIKPTMTVKQIRDYIKSLKDGTDKAEKVIEDTSIKEEEIPMAYDPKKEYEFSYFESKTKNQLINMIWELQKVYQKLKSKKG